MLTPWINPLFFWANRFPAKYLTENLLRWATFMVAVVRFTCFSHTFQTCLTLSPRLGSKMMVRVPKTALGCYTFTPRCCFDFGLSFVTVVSATCCCWFSSLFHALVWEVLDSVDAKLTNIFPVNDKNSSFDPCCFLSLPLFSVGLGWTWLDWSWHRTWHLHFISLGHCLMWKG